MTQSGKLTPNLDPQSTKMLNLTVLQRTDPFLEEILLTAAHVTFYEFNIESSQWSRKDVEGSLFVVKRNTHPRFRFIVMNRRNTDNLVEDLLQDFEFEVQLPYLLYRNAAQEVNGIWFYNARECEDVGNLFSRILNTDLVAREKPNVSSKKSGFEELEATPSMSVVDGPLEPSSTASRASNATHNPPDSSFLNFFNAALNTISSTSSIPTSRYPQHNIMPLQASSKVPGVTSAASAPQPQPVPLATSSTLTFHESPDPVNYNEHVTNLVKPSSFFSPTLTSPYSLTIPPVTQPVSSLKPTAPVLQPLLSLQRPYGSPLLQPFPPPTPPLSISPGSDHADGLAINKTKVRDALLMLVQDDQFVEMVYQAIQKAHHA